MSPYFNFSVKQADRVNITGYNPKLIWFTGLCASGKSTLANALEIKLNSLGYLTYILDGDNLRAGINRDLDFTEEGRRENLRRAAEIARMLLDSSIVVIGAFVSPLESDRQMVKEIAGGENYVEVFVNTPLSECEKRDLKGLYRKARSGEINNFTGISAPYENPSAPFLEVNTLGQPVSVTIEIIYSKIIALLQ
jgi:adenylylsulfate kinase